MVENTTMQTENQSFGNKFQVPTDRLLCERIYYNEAIKVLVRQMTLNFDSR